jgi:hypothetical protein
VDLRGLLAAIHLMDKGLEADKALQMGITPIKPLMISKRKLVEDVIRLRIPAGLERDAIFRD